MILNEHDVQEADWKWGSSNRMQLNILDIESLFLFPYAFSFGTPSSVYTLAFFPCILSRAEEEQQPSIEAISASYSFYMFLTCHF